MAEYREIRSATDVTDDHVAEAVDMRDGLYGGRPLTWEEIIWRLERSDEDWGTDLDSEAIRELKRRVRREMTS